MRRTVLFTLLVALALGTVPAAASTFLAMSRDELVAGADAVVQGRVIDQQSFWSEGGRVVVTEATVKVRQVIAGQAPDVVRVRTVGGTIGDYRVEAHGFPQFDRGQKVILFLTFEQAGEARVLGYQLGHYEVVRRLDGVRLAVPQVEDGAAFFTASGQLAPEPRSVPLSQFKRSIRDIARETFSK